MRMHKAVGTLLLTLASAICFLAVTAVSQAARQGEAQVITLRALTPVYMKALSEFAPWSEKELEVSRLKAYPAKVWVPKGKVSFDVEPPPNTSFLGRVSFLVNVKVDGQIARRVRVCGWVEVYRHVLSFARPLKKGHVLKEEDLVLSRRPLSRLNGHVMEDPKKVVGLALKRSVRAGQALTANMLTRPLAVRRGDRVTIVAEGPTISITVPGEVKQDGAEGSFIRVRNLMSQREVSAQVLNSKTVRVFF